MAAIPMLSNVATRMPVRMIGQASGNSISQQTLAGVEAHALGRLDDRSVDVFESDDGVAQNGQDRVHREGDDRAPVTDADRRDRDEDGEKSQRRNRQHDRGDSEDQAPKNTNPVDEHTEHDRDDDGEEHRHRNELNVFDDTFEDG